MIGSNSHPFKVRTGGGPPIPRHQAHLPIGGMPRGQSSDVNVTWIPTVESRVEYTPAHPQVVYPFPTPGPRVYARRGRGFWHPEYTNQQRIAPVPGYRHR